MLSAPQVDRAVASDADVALLQSAIHTGKNTVAAIPGLVKRIIREGYWVERDVRVTREHVRFERFEQFVAATLPDGLGIDMATLKRLCRDDAEAVDLIDQATQQPPGRPAKKESIDNVTHLKEGPDGNSKEQALRRLRKDRPDLHAEVIAGEKSPHAAMVEAGFRPKTVTVQPTVEGFAKSIAKFLSAEDQARLVAALMGFTEAPR